VKLIDARHLDELQVFFSTGDTSCFISGLCGDLNATAPLANQSANPCVIENKTKTNQILHLEDQLQTDTLSSNQ
jgi:hypothetical protein